MLNNQETVSVTISNGRDTRTLTGDFSVNIVMKQMGAGYLAQNGIVGKHDIHGALAMLIQLRSMEKEIKSGLPLPEELIDFLIQTHEKDIIFNKESKPVSQDTPRLDQDFLSFLKKLLGEDFPGF